MAIALGTFKNGSSSKKTASKYKLEFSTVCLYYFLVCNAPLFSF